MLYYSCNQYSKDFILQSELEDFVNHQVLTQLIPTFATHEGVARESRGRTRDRKSAVGEDEEDEEEGEDGASCTVDGNQYLDVDGKGTLTDKLLENSGQLYSHMTEGGVFHSFG